jgi:hypothetical protein
VLGRHGGDVWPEICGVVEVFGVSAVYAEAVVGSDRRQMPDDVVDHTLLQRQLLARFSQRGIVLKSGSHVYASRRSNAFCR